MAVKIETGNTAKFKMKYFKFGCGEQTVVVIPGLSLKSVTESANGIANVFKLMGDKYTVYFFDRRTDCGEDYNVKDMADDTAEALDILGISGAYVYGVSQGGMIAQLIALKRPDLVKKLALASTTSRFTGDNSAVIEKWADLAAKKKILELINCFIEAVYSKEFAEKFGELIRQMLIGVSADELHRFEIYARACNGFDVYDKLDKIACPVYAAGATGDKVFGCEPIAELAEKTNAQLYIYENYSHAVYDEAPDFIERLVKFFDE